MMLVNFILTLIYYLGSSLTPAITNCLITNVFNSERVMDVINSSWTISRVSTEFTADVSEIVHHHLILRPQDDGTDSI
jgi:hypothetical protein